MESANTNPKKGYIHSQSSTLTWGDPSDENHGPKSPIGSGGKWGGRRILHLSHPDATDMVPRKWWEGVFFTLPRWGHAHLASTSSRWHFTWTAKGCPLEEAASMNTPQQGKGKGEKIPSPFTGETCLTMSYSGWPCMAACWNRLHESHLQREEVKSLLLSLPRLVPQCHFYWAPV